MYKKYIEGSIGRMRLADIKYSDVKKFYNSLVYDNGFKLNSLKLVYAVLNPVFSTAVKDGYIRINPNNGVMAEMKKNYNFEKTKRHALTEAEQEAFIEFVKSHSAYRYWLPLFTVLLGTGCRIGEVIGLTWNDCDFKNDIISINHSLLYKPNERTNKSEFYISAPKTKSGEREVPMFKDVKRVLLEERSRQELNDIKSLVV